MNPDPGTAEGGHEKSLRGQRDLAVIGGILASALATAVLWSNFGKEFPEVEATRQAVRQHQALMRGNQEAVWEIQAAIQANQQELERLRRVKPGAP